MPTIIVIGMNEWGRREAVRRFWSHADQSGGPDACWPWRAYIDRVGYGRGGGSPYYDGTYAHRIAWQLHTGEPIPAGLELDHLCRVRHCVNPAHLEAVTHAENMRRGGLARTGGVCRCGAPREVGSRCRACYNAYMRAYLPAWRARQRSR